MRKHSFWTALCSCIFVSLNLSAQDKICLATEIRQVKVTDISPTSVKYLSADDPTQTVELPLNKVLVLFNVQGGYLVPAQIDAASATGKAALSRFFSISGDERNTDELISKAHKVLDVNISNEDDQYIYWDNDNKIAKTDLAVVIYNNGTPKIFCPMEDAATILGTCRNSALNLVNPPGSVTTTTPAKSAATDSATTTTPPVSKPVATTPATTTPTTTTPTTTSMRPAPPPAPDPSTTRTTPPSTTATTPERSTANAVTNPDEIHSKDSAAQRKIDSLLGGKHITRDEFGEKCTQKTRRFTNYMLIFCDKKTPNTELDKATQGCVDLFIDENAKVTVSTNNKDDIKDYPIRTYLRRLKMLPYDRITVTWVNVQYLDDLKLDEKGILHGTVSFEQEFKAYKDNELVYSDVTTKTANVVLKTYSSSSEGRTTTGWDVRLADVGVSGTRAL